MALGRGFASGFLMGVQGAKSGIDVYNQAKEREREEKMRAELEAVGNANTTDLAPVSDLTATPSEDGGPAVTTETQVAPKQFGFLGKTYDQAPTDSQQANARTMAMAGIIKKYDPVRGMQMEQSAISAQRDEQRFGREQKRWNQEDDELKKKKDYEEGRKAVFSSSRFGMAQSQHEKQMAKYQADLEKYEADKAAGKSGPELGLAPVAPARPEYSIGDSLADRAALIDHDAKHGKLDSRAFGEFTDLLNKVQSEGYEKVLRLAQAGAPIQEVAKAFNASGKVQFDPASVVSDKVVKGKDGVETRVIQYKDGQGNVRTINALAELDSMGKAGEVFTRHFQTKQDQRADRADSRAGAQFAQSQADRTESKDEKKARVEAGVALYKEKNPEATKAEIDAVRSGILEATPTTDKNAPSEVKLAKAMVSAGLASDMRTGLEMAITKKSQSAKEAYLDLMKPQGGIAPREEDVAVVMETAFGSEWRNKVAGKGKTTAKDSGLASDPKAIAIRDDKNLTLEQKRAKLKELGYQ